MTDNRTTGVQLGRPKKQALVPPPKKEPSTEDGFVTPRGGEFSVEFVPQAGLYAIRAHQGVLPVRLRGMFTELEIAQYQIKRYLEEYWKGRS